MSEETIPLTSGLLNALVDFAKFIDAQGLTVLPLGDSILSIKEVKPFNIITRVNKHQDLILIEPMLQAIGTVLMAFVDVYSSIGMEWDYSQGLEEGLEKELKYLINIKYLSSVHGITNTNLLVLLQDSKVEILAIYPYNTDSVLISEVKDQFEIISNFPVKSDKRWGFIYLESSGYFMLNCLLNKHNTSKFYLVRLVSYDELLTSFFICRQLYQKALTAFSPYIDDSQEIIDLKQILGIIGHNNKILYQWSEMEILNFKSYRNIIPSDFFYLINRFFGDIILFILEAICTFKKVYLIGKEVFYPHVKIIFSQLFPYIPISKPNDPFIAHNSFLFVTREHYLKLIENFLIKSSDFVFDLDHQQVINGSSGPFVEYLYHKMMANNSTNAFEILHDHLRWFAHKTFSLLSLNTNPKFILDDEFLFFDDDGKPAAKLLGESLLEIAFTPKIFESHESKKYMT